MTASKGNLALATTLIWCVETPVANSGYHMLFWRALDTDGKDAANDRLSVVTADPSPFLMLGPDGGGIRALLASTNGEKEKWSATMVAKGQTLIYGYFDGRPPAATAVDLFAKVLNGEAKPVGGYGAKGKNLMIVAPPEGK